MNKTDLAQYVTDMMVAELERGIVPWRKPWSAAGYVPTSLSTGKPYRGINTFILALVGQSKGYESNLWTTYKQASERGGNVRKGEKSTTVVYWKILDVKDKATGEPKKVPFLKHFNVFNLDQCDGLDAYRGKPEPRTVVVEDAVHATWQGYVDGPTLRHVAGDRAYYSPTDDQITMPLVESFHDGAAYAETLFHEMTHSTGHQSRLGRLGGSVAVAAFGSPDYAKEELVAELGAVMLLGHAGIPVDAQNSASYVGGWLRALQDDRNLIISAAQQAQKAFDRIVGSTE